MSGWPGAGRSMETRSSRSRQAAATAARSRSTHAAGPPSTVGLTAGPDSGTTTLTVVAAFGASVTRYASAADA